MKTFYYAHLGTQAFIYLDSPDIFSCPLYIATFYKTEISGHLRTFPKSCIMERGIEFAPMLFLALAFKGYVEFTSARKYRTALRACIKGEIRIL